MTTDIPQQPGPGLNITYQPYGKSGGVVVTLRLADGAPFTDRVSITDSAKRARFLDELMERYPGVVREEVAAELERIAAETMAQAPGSTGGGDQDSQATRLIAMIEADPSVELFHSPGDADALAFASYQTGETRQTRPLNSKGFRQWLSQKFYTSEGEVPNSQALSDAINTLSGKAVYDGPEHAVHLRVAEHRGEIWIDLCDSAWRAVKITTHGWEVVDRDIPVRFIRRRAMLSLPAPERGGSIGDLRALVNLPEDHHWILAVAWVVAAFRPGRPFTVLNVTGEQGSAKSTLSKMLRSLIDPAKPQLRRPPKDDRDLMIAANNSWIVAYDNISSISNALSDSMCSLATGGGFATRELYTNDEEAVFDATRPVLVNGIDDAVTRPDLLDRSVNIHLPVIPQGQRRDEDEVWGEFNRLRPRILGALFNAVSTALGRIATVKLSDKPRMADFALWVVAAEPALPWSEGEFITAYNRNRDDGTALAIEASPVAGAILALLEDKRTWRGTAGALLGELNERLAAGGTKLANDWPTNRKAMGGAVRRIAPSLRLMGLRVVVPDKAVGRRKGTALPLSSGSSACSTDA